MREKERANRRRSLETRGILFLHDFFFFLFLRSDHQRFSGHIVAFCDGVGFRKDLSYTSFLLYEQTRVY